MGSKGRLQMCSVECSGGMTGGSYHAVAKRNKNGTVTVSVQERMFFHAPLKKKKQTIPAQVFDRLEQMLSAFDFDRTASPEVIAERRQWIALDAPDESVIVKYENASYQLKDDTTAPENCSACEILNRFFDEFWNPSP